MKRYLLLLFTIANITAAVAQPGTLLPDYNTVFYPSVLAAARGVAEPFLLQQQYLSMPGLSVDGSAISYEGQSYAVSDAYLNPITGNAYFISPNQYNSYGIGVFDSIWPIQFPNILYTAADTGFYAQSDCVGYLTRVLSATGDTSAAGNAYLNIIDLTHAANVAPFAIKGYVATAYSFAVAFPTLPDSVSSGWQYICGNVEPATIDTYDIAQVHTLGAYNGVRKGGFRQSLAGDILAFGYSRASSSNGHIMVLETAPQLLNADSLPTYFPSQSIVQATALLSARNMYSVSVFDCSIGGVEAHFSDSRILGGGVGHGKLLILTDTADDAPTGFIFDSIQAAYNPPHMDTLGTSVYAISVGRFVTASTLGIAGTGSANTLFQVYPNPSDGELHIAVPVNVKVQVTIFAADGSIRYQCNSASSLLSPDTRHWPAGLYLIQYRQDNGLVSVLKWVKVYE